MPLARLFICYTTNLSKVIAFDLRWAGTDGRLIRALNGRLPPDVACRQVSPCPADFNPRTSATFRQYVYRIHLQEHRSPLQRTTSWHQPFGPWDMSTLNVQSLFFTPQSVQAACELIKGTHDFGSFGLPMRPGGSTVRTVFDAGWCALEPCLEFTIVGTAFLRHMVRSLVGTMAQVGSGRMSLQDLTEVLQARDRNAAGPVAPAHGLELVRVGFNEETCKELPILHNVPLGTWQLTEKAPAKLTRMPDHN